MTPDFTDTELRDGYAIRTVIARFGLRVEKSETVALFTARADVLIWRSRLFREAHKYDAPTWVCVCMN